MSEKTTHGSGGGHSLGHAAGHINHGGHAIQKAFDEKATPGDAFLNGACGTAVVAMAAAPFLPITLAVGATAAVVVGGAALLKSLFK